MLFKENYFAILFNPFPSWHFRALLFFIGSMGVMTSIFTKTQPFNLLTTKLPYFLSQCTNGFITFGGGGAIMLRIYSYITWQSIKTKKHPRSIFRLASGTVVLSFSAALKIKYTLRVFKNRGTKIKLQER